MRNTIKIYGFSIVKVNNGNLEQIVDTRDKDISVVTNTNGNEQLEKDEAGGFNYTSFTDLMKISQSLQVIEMKQEY